MSRLRASGGIQERCGLSSSSGDRRLSLDPYTGYLYIELLWLVLVPADKYRDNISNYGILSQNPGLYLRFRDCNSDWGIVPQISGQYLKFRDSF